MITLAICDDERASLDRLAACARRLARAGDLSFQMKLFSSAEELLGSWQEIDILLLDVQMGGMDGISAARCLREQGCQAVIILVTNYVQYAIDGYEVQAFHFLKKPVEYQRFKQVVGKALELADRQEKASITVRGDDQMVSLLICRIRYCETDRGRVLIHGEGKQVRCYSSMSQLEKQLGPEGFFRCHAAFLVNMAQVERLMPAQVQLKDGTDIPVSKHRRKDFREALAQYWGEKFL